MNNGEQFFNTAAGGYSISRSLRFNAADSSFLSRTPASAGNRKTWTWAGWVKRSALATGQRQSLFSSTGASDPDWCEFGFEDGLFYITTFNSTNFSSSVYRDASAWYHVVVAFDTALATASDRATIWINNVRMPITVNIFSQNTDYGINRAAAHNIGNSTYISRYFNGYLADIHFIDGQALDPTSFGEFSATTGVWVPKAYSGSYGTNGFHLDFADNSAATAAALGKDTSGLGNNWLPNNLSVANPAITYGTVTSGNAQYALDGSTTTFLGIRPNGAGLTLGSSIVASSKIRVYVSAESGTVYLNKTINTGQNVVYPSAGWVDVSSSVSFPFTLSSVGYAGGWLGDGALIYAIEVDNSVLNLPINTSDSLVDAPTNGSEVDTGLGGEVRGNYAVLNPLLGSGTKSDGNLTTTTPNAYSPDVSTIAPSSGKWYFEVTWVSGQYARIGVQNVTRQSSDFGSDAYGWRYESNTGNVSSGGSTLATGNTYTPGDIIGVAYDCDAGKMWVAKNGTWQNSGNPATGANASATNLPVGVPLAAGMATGTNTSVFTANFGQRPFAYTAPSGFKALCTANLPAPVITKPSTVFDVKLYTGNGITQMISGLGFSPDLVWIKERSSTAWNALFDTIRGANKALYSNDTNQEETLTNTFQSFNSDGFSLSYNSAYSSVFTNRSSQTYAAWCWDAGNTTVTNTQGSITSQVRANASAGFSIVTYTGNGTAGATVGHGLGVAPALAIWKRRNAVSDWLVLGSALGANQYLWLESTNAAGTDTNIFGASSTTLTLQNFTNYNANGGTYVCYAFSPVVGYSSMGSYIGNGSSDGSFIYTGHRTRFLLIKAYDATATWSIFDAARDPYNVGTKGLYPNSSGAEESIWGVDFLSNGFKLRTSNGGVNQSGLNYIYASFAESPFAANNRAR